MRYDIYTPEAFGFLKDPRGDSGGAVFVRYDDRGMVGTGSVLSYILLDDNEMLPYFDSDSAIEFQWDGAIPGEPVFRGAEVSEKGDILLKYTDDVMLLSERQEALLNNPLCILTNSGCYRRDTNEKYGVFRKDETLDYIEPRSLNMSRVFAVLYSTCPRLMGKSKMTYGNLYPNFPNAKVITATGDIVVFIEKGQVVCISESVIKGKVPLFRDGAAECRMENVSEFCVIDASTNQYKVRVMTPEQFVLYWSYEVQKQNSASDFSGTL